jgi:putative RNA 2'-phosphotransferase
MDKSEARSKSKFLSLVLRHRPETIGIELDESGWVKVETLLDAMQKHRKPISRENLNQVVTTNDKQRFEFSADGHSIRARQGHSLNVDLGYKAARPPEFLVHGTPQQFVASIQATGLKKQQRHHVHLHENKTTAIQAGGRRGKPVLLNILASKMHAAGHEFFVTENGVWLTDHVPVEFIEFPQ